MMRIIPKHTTLALGSNSAVAAGPNINSISSTILVEGWWYFVRNGKSLVQGLTTELGKHIQVVSVTEYYFLHLFLSELERYPPYSSKGSRSGLIRF
jgi:hypothetical protein